MGVEALVVMVEPPLLNYVSTVHEISEAMFQHRKYFLTTHSTKFKDQQCQSMSYHNPWNAVVCQNLWRNPVGSIHTFSYLDNGNLD